ncbi:MAG: helix-turn-helix domain-containing protein [Lachnospiraceae bacterium]|nr:helix-turn-helix domain-containing protein [Lachnospiraceae bacterium]
MDAKRESFDVLTRLTELRTAKGLSVYKLSKLSEIPQSTIATWYQKQLYPPIDKLECICAVLGISLADFFNTEEERYLADKQDIALLERWHLLTSKEREVVLSMIDLLLSNHKKSVTALLPDELCP